MQLASWPGCMHQCMDPLHAVKRLRTVMRARWPEHDRVLDDVRPEMTRMQASSYIRCVEGLHGSGGSPISKAGGLSNHLCCQTRWAGNWNSTPFQLAQVRPESAMNSCKWIAAFKHCR